MFRLRWVSCYPLLLQMVSVAWLFVFSKFIELTDTVSELLGRPCAGGRLGLCWMGTWSRCFLQPFPSGLPVLLSGVTAGEVTGLWQKPLAG